MPSIENRRPRGVRGETRQRDRAAAGAPVLLCAAALALTGVMAALTWDRSHAVSPDSCAYMLSGVSLIEGRGFIDLSGAPMVTFPPGFPVFIGLLTQAVGDPVIAGRLISAAASALSVIPLMLIANCLFGRWTAAASGFIYAVMPLRLHVASKVWSESLYVLVVLSAVWLWMREGESSSRARAIGVGVLLGLACLVRPEAAACAAVLVAFAVLGRRWWKTPSWESTALTAAALALVVLPYVVYLHAHTGRWNISVKGEMNYRIGIARSYDISWSEVARLDEDGAEMDLQVHTETPAEFARRYALNVRAEAREVRNALGVVLGTCLLLGMCLEVRRGNAVLWQSAPVVCALGVPLAYLPVFYIEPRYVFLGIFPLLILACWQMVARFGASASDMKSGRMAAAAVLPIAIVMLLTVRQIGGVMPPKPPELGTVFEVAAWMKGHLPEESRVLTSYPEIAFRSRHFAYLLPYDTVPRTVSYCKRNDIRYILVHRDDLLSPDMRELVSGRVRSAGVVRLGRWDAPSGWWAVLYEVKGADEHPRSAGTAVWL